MKTALIVVVAFLASPALANAGNHCRGCIPVFAPVVIQPQPVYVQPVPVAVVPVAPVRRYYATPLRDLLFGQYRWVPVVPATEAKTSEKE